MSKSDQPAGRLCLETGEVFDGVLFGSDPGQGNAWGEIVFNTCMTGYQEIASDPSYAGQMVVMTYPMIGNYGCRDDAMESSRFYLQALVVRQLSPTPVRASAERSLVAELEAHDIPCLSGVDTRALTRRIRSHGSVRAVLARSDAMSAEEQIALARRSPTVSDQDLVAQVSQAEPWKHWSGALLPELEWPVTHAIRADRFRGCVVVCLDLGVKRNQLRALASRGVHVVTVSHDATIEDILALKPDGIVLSNDLVTAMCRSMTAALPIRPCAMGTTLETPRSDIASHAVHRSTRRRRLSMRSRATPREWSSTSLR